MTKVEFDLPDKLNTFITELVKKQQFTSLDDFVKHAVFMLAELYGYPTETGGLKKALESLSINQTGASTAQGSQATGPQGLTPLEQDIMDCFQGAKYEFEAALYGTYQMNNIRTGKPPISKADFVKALETMKEKGILERGEHMGKIIWKII